MSWKPGDLAQYIGPEVPEKVGSIVEVTTYPMDWKDTGQEYVICTPLIRSINGVFTKNIIPIPDEYDGNETTTWDECPFQPKELVVTT